MSQQIINTGTADKGNGDPIRTAFTKVNANFAELYNSVSAVVVTGATAPTSPGVGDLWWDTESGRMYVYYGSTWVDASPVDGAGISSTNELVNGAHTVSLGSNGYITLANGAQLYDYGSGTGNGYGITDSVNGTYIGYDPTDNLGALHMDSYNGKNIRIRTTTLPSTYRNWLFGADGSLTFPDGTTTTGKSITVPVDQSLTVNTSYSMGPGGATTFKISPEHIKLPTGNGVIFSGTETAANSWGLDSANKTLYFPDAGDGVNPQIYYSKVDGVTGMELMTYAKSIKITAAQTSSWTFGADGELSLPTNGYTEAVIKELDATALVLFAQKAGANVKILAGATSAGSAKQWLFDGTDGGLTLPTGGTVSFTPTTPSNWTGTAPTTIQEAINRIAAILANQGYRP